MCIRDSLNIFIPPPLVILNELSLNPNILLSGDVTRLSSVLYLRYCIQESNLIPRFSQVRARCKFRALYDACSIVKSWVLEWIRILVGSSDTCGRANPIMDTFGRGNLWIREKKLRIKNIRIRVSTGPKCLKNGSDRLRKGQLIRRRILGEQPNSLEDEARMKSPEPWVAKYIVPFSYLMVST